MVSSVLRIAVLVLSSASILHAAAPDISNLSNCINEVRQSEAHPPAVLTFDSYETSYKQLLTDLQSALPHLPHVYQEAAAKPLIQFLQNMGQSRFLKIFSSQPQDDQTALLQALIPDAALAILSYQGMLSQGINAFQEVVSDIYDGFLSDESRVSKATGMPIAPPTYGSIPPLVKFGSEDDGPYTWPADDTSQALGMGCGIVSLPPSQIKGGLLAWSALGHETGGHDVTHADAGLLQELAQNVSAAIMQKFNSKPLATYWANCIDESSADVCGYLNVGPSFGISLIGYFRGLENGRLSTIGSTSDPHPIDLLRGYLGAAVVKRLSFKDAAAWSQAITAETHKDDGTLYLVNARGRKTSFPVSLSVAIASTDVVAQVIMQTKLKSLQGHSLQDLQDWKDQDQAAVDNLVAILKMNGRLPASLQGPGFYAAYVVAAACQAALQKGANIPMLFSEMQSFLALMHQANPTWSTMPTTKSMALLSQDFRVMGEGTPRALTPKSLEPAHR